VRAALAVVLAGGAGVVVDRDRAIAHHRCFARTSHCKRESADYSSPAASTIGNCELHGR